MATNRFELDEKTVQRDVITLWRGATTRVREEVT